MSFASYLTASSSQLAVAGLDNSLVPSVWICSPQLTNCTQANAGLGDVDAVTALQYDGAGNLYGIFNEPQGADAFNPYRAITKKLAAGGGSWQAFNSYNGLSLGLDVGDAGILMSSSFKFPMVGAGLVNFGAVKLFDAKGNVLASGVNQESSSLVAVAGDGKGKVYVGGLDFYTDADLSKSQPFASVWLWDRSGTGSFSRITLPTKIVTITDLVGDGNGSVYISGTDYLNRGRVWQYRDGVVADTGLAAAFQVEALYWSPNGYLVAAGADNVDYNGQVWYLVPGAVSWVSLNLKNAAKIVNVTGNQATNAVYVVGTNSQDKSTIWAYQ